jgi:hypothetical protein
MPFCCSSRGSYRRSEEAARRRADQKGCGLVRFTARVTDPLFSNASNRQLKSTARQIETSMPNTLWRTSLKAVSAK